MYVTIINLKPLALNLKENEGLRERKEKEEMIQLQNYIYYILIAIKEKIEKGVFPKKCVCTNTMAHDLVSHLHVASSGYVVSIVKGAHFSLGLLLEIQLYTLDFHTSTTFKRRKTFKFFAEMKSSIYENYPHTRMNHMERQGGI